MSDIQCFWLEETGKLARSLRRYADKPCEGSWGYHNASARIKDGEAPTREMISLSDQSQVEAFKDDSRWPTRCDSCDYEFRPDDHWQVFASRIYRRTDRFELMTLRNAPAGAMWDAWWLSHGSEIPKPDSVHLMVKTPDGDWYVDGKASNGPGWTRTGDPRATPPTVTAAPSILSGKYHGWLRNGSLVTA